MKYACSRVCFVLWWFYHQLIVDICDQFTQITQDPLIGTLPTSPDSKAHGANMGPIWGRQDPSGPHVGPMNIATWVIIALLSAQYSSRIWVDKIDGIKPQQTQQSAHRVSISRHVLYIHITLQPLPTSSKDMKDSSCRTRLVLKIYPLKHW